MIRRYLDMLIYCVYFRHPTSRLRAEKPWKAETYARSLNGRSDGTFICTSRNVACRSSESVTSRLEAGTCIVRVLEFLPVISYSVMHVG